jgi:hypothetical protein
MILWTLERSLSRRVSRQIWESRDKIIHIRMKANARASNAFILTKIGNLHPRGGSSSILTSNDMNIEKKRKLFRLVFGTIPANMILSRRVYFWEHLPYHVMMKRLLFSQKFTFVWQICTHRSITGRLSFGVLKFDRCLISWLRTHVPSTIGRLVSDQCVVLQSGSFEWLVDLASFL